MNIMLSPKLHIFIVLLISGIFLNNFVICVKYVDDDVIDDNKDENILEESYHGLIKENETLVEITPLIKVEGGNVCGFHLIKRNKEIPFQIELINDLGILKAKKSLNCEKRKTYKFEIAAVFCDGTYSNSANVHISVIDINEYAPTFLQPSYVTQVDEGRLYEEIIRVEATDKDCTPLNGDVCKYELLNNDQPFTIDNEGSIRNTEPLSHKQSHNHILSVVAYDCAMKQSAAVMVTIRVRRVCEAHIMGVPERIDYTVNSMESIILFPKIHLELCDMQCKNDDMIVQSSVNLKTKHIAFGCDRNTNKCQQDQPVNTNKMNLVDLLRKDNDWSKDLVYDEGQESVFHFDGSSGTIIPKSYIEVANFAAKPFSIVTMFRHHSTSSSNRHLKEHIICNADDHKMNRHHMALFVRNCRLILLLRKDYNDGENNIFSPAEWRWKIPQVCDNEWHHYTINYDTYKIDLYIDGVKFESNTIDKHNNPEVIDDWPLHAAHGINTTLTIGGCYQSSENRLKHGFVGDISEIKLSIGETLNNDLINCGIDCAEYLVTPKEHYLGTEQQIQTNKQMNKIIIEGKNLTNIEVLLRNIKYVNNKPQPTIGRRNIEIITTINCPNDKIIRLPTIDTYIMIAQSTPIQQPQSTPSSGVSVSSSSSSVIVQSSSLSDSNKEEFLLNSNDKPQILITGQTNYLITYQDIKKGVKILSSLNVSVVLDKKTPKNLQYLDSCSLTVYPSLNPDHEEIVLNNNDYKLSSQFDIKININKDGVEMVGYDTIDNYLNVLKLLIYSNKKPAYYLNRVFKLQCSQLNQHFHSVEHILTLTVLHPKQQQNQPSTITVTKSTTPTLMGGAGGGTADSKSAQSAAAPTAHDSNHKEENVFAHALIHSHDIEEPHSKIHNVVQKVQNTSHSTMLIIVICTSFVILICGVGIARLRGNQQQKKIDKQHQQTQAKLNSEQQQLDWDDSALTITINPMQNDLLSDESSDSENSDSDDDEVVNGRYKNVNQLEWDNSTM